ncbi:hypothetical protein QYM36_019213 [Artemia franciscana]|uniref:PiggyBac transposable element-derived protein domain-containing protein n=1 Tax=Artemia franciscana TaxID=6661 RepID=A0AA88H1H8_ARTSF|nr:hypothetical protein QYM36_019213 [Artemia franciscana]
MVPFKGCLGFKQYKKDKPNKWGIKIFSRSGASGIVYDSKVYSGKGTTVRSDLGFASDMVLRLVEYLSKSQNSKIFFYYFFSSFHIVENLQQMGIESVGTVRIERVLKAKLPPLEAD